MLDADGNVTEMKYFESNFSVQRAQCENNRHDIIRRYIVNVSYAPHGYTNVGCVVCTKRRKEALSCPMATVVVEKRRLRTVRTTDVSVARGRSESVLHPLISLERTIPFSERGRQSVFNLRRNRAGPPVHSFPDPFSRRCRVWCE